METTMKFQFILFLCISFFTQTAWGVRFSFGRNFGQNSVSTLPKYLNADDNVLFSSSETSDAYNTSEYRSEEGNTEYSQMVASENSSQTDQNVSASASSNQTLSSAATGGVPGSSNSTETLIAIFSNESHSQSSTQRSSSESSATTNQGTNSSMKPSIFTTASKTETNLTSSEDEQEGVARGKPSTTESTSTSPTQSPTLYQKAWTLISDTYTLSILVPVAAGVVFASTIILTIATCRCLRRRCIRRRLRKKTLPDSVKNLRPSDRARLLAESSDEEF